MRAVIPMLPYCAEYKIRVGIFYIVFGSAGMAFAYLHAAFAATTPKGKVGQYERRQTPDHRTSGRVYGTVGNIYILCPKPDAVPELG